MNQNTNYRWWLLALFVCGLIYLLSPILTPFLIAAILAYISNPMVNKLAALKLSRWQLNRTWAAVIVLLVFFGILLMFLLIILPMMQKEFLLILQKLPNYFNTLKNSLEPWLMQHFAVSLDFDVAQIQAGLTEHWKTAGNVAKQIALGLSTNGLALIGTLATLFLVPVVLFYLLVDWNIITAKLFELLPRKFVAKTSQICNEIDTVLAEFLRGQLTVMILMSVFYGVGLWFAGLEFALPIGLISGMLGFIPYVGFGIGFMLAIVSSLLEHGGLNHLFPVLAVFGLGQILESMLLTPWLVGDRIGLHPLAVIFALMAGGQLFGFSGVLLALPVSAAIAVGLKHAKDSYLNSHFYNE